MKIAEVWQTNNQIVCVVKDIDFSNHVYKGVKLAKITLFMYTYSVYPAKISNER